MYPDAGCPMVEIPIKRIPNRKDRLEITGRVRLSGRVGEVVFTLDPEPLLQVLFREEDSLIAHGQVRDALAQLGKDRPDLGELWAKT